MSTKLAAIVAPLPRSEGVPILDSRSSTKLSIAKISADTEAPAGAPNLAKGTLGTFDVFNPQGQFVKTVTLQGEGDPLEDLYVFEKDRLYVVTSFLQAAMSAEGVDGLYDETEEPEPMAVICYRLEGDVIAAR